MSIIISGDSDPKNVHAGGSIAWMFDISTNLSNIKLRISIITGPDIDNAPEWDISLYDSSLNKLWSSYSNVSEIPINFHKVSPKDFKLEVVCPRGARYNDKVAIEVIASSESDIGSTIFEAMARQSIMILKTQIDQEKNVAEALA